MNSYLRKFCYKTPAILINRIIFLAILSAPLSLGSLPAVAGTAATAYTPPNISNISAASLRSAYAAQLKLDYLLAPIHSRAELKEYLQVTANSGSPLDALTTYARQRFLSSLVFTQGGLGSFSYADLQYLSASQIYKILSLFGVQSATPMIKGAQTLNTTDLVIMGMPTPDTDYWNFRCAPPATCVQQWNDICIGNNCQVK